MKDNILNLTPQQIALKCIQAYNSHNPDIIASFYDENVTNTQLPYLETAKGREAIRKTYENVFRAFPDIRIDAENIFEQDS